MKLFISILLSALTITVSAQKKVKTFYVSIETNKGASIVKLYNETPKHRDNFLKLTREGFYNGTLFHRVIKNFMIQGGDPNSKTADTSASLGSGDVGYRIPAEFNENLFHKKGVLAAARDNNPEKASSGAQFYLVQGKVFTDSTLNALETNRLKFKIPEYQREVYKTLGGTPHLDRNYTVYGEVVKGIEMIDKVAESPTKKGDRPIEDVKMTVRELKKREVRKLEKELQLAAKNYNKKP